MLRWWPSSWTSPPDPPGAALQAAAVGTVAAAAAGNVWPPQPFWVWPLVVLALAAGLVALRSGRPLIWFGCGVLVGFATVAAAPRAERPGPVPVRFAVTIRDGWTTGTRGWTTRVRVGEISGARGRVRTASELMLALGGEVTASQLPTPGSRCEGAGELLFDRENDLRPPLLRVKTKLLLRSQPPPRWSVDALRERLAARLQRAAGEGATRCAGAALASALVLGRREALDREAVGTLRLAGLAHILSVSGLHVVLVSTLVWWLLTVFGLAPRARRMVLVPALLGFAMLSGGTAPVLRATAATVAYLLTRLAGRPVLPLPAMWAVVGGLVVLEPTALLQPGFQLSAGVSLALIRWVGQLGGAVEVLPRWLRSGLAVACVGQLASWPLVGVAFAGVPPLGVLANLVAAPLALPLVGASLAAVLLAAIWASGAGGLAWVVGIGNAALVHISGWGSGSTWLFAPPPPALLATGAALLVFSVVSWRRAWVPALTLSVGSIVWTLAPALPLRATGEVRMLPVSDGMALLVRARGARVLVDAGRGASEALRGLAAVRVRRVDALVITHADADHTGGAAAVLERVRVGELVLPRVIADRPELQPLRRIAERRGVAVRLAAAGDRFGWGELGCRVLWPPAAGGLADNDLSLVAVLDSGGMRLLVTGDVEAGGEAAVVGSGADLRAEVLQLPHHGSRTSSSGVLLEAVRPRVAMAPTGTRPRFTYPDPQVVARLRALPALVVAQVWGVERVWWDEGRVFVGTPVPVSVPAEGRSR
ncbi:MAG: DNA internalization-related competence protein ComEC/Rec2 [Thermoanaerobaculaceae bacterium]|nr:DNA internalization-related competence protein ComEC/Rec2 [Thermoanaerobaculaceae bacterium]MDI9622225.1 DNA internalization-related competence protein ComEC/Rec2 [Acidobacteriota bacterium]NLH10543.1 DNA internalization-related competence protein ComEC/Rec2 [Holophagae bacterium]HPW56849.1 DNA internalization-related competence protein ComEC/Rec2 [Thermoanaerobaculaceae bacterium]